MPTVPPPSRALFVGARLAGEGDLKDAFAGKPGSYEFCDQPTGISGVMERA
jgi:hypothetical protein